METDNDRLAREQDFHDRRFADDGHARQADRFYGIVRASGEHARRHIASLRSGGLMLDYGCGESAYAAIDGARRGLRAIAIDISPVAIEQARHRAEAAGVADAIEFRVMNAETLDFADEQFDYIVGYGVIHHLDIVTSLSEIARVLKSDGSAMFIEPMGHNPLINFYRRRTPEQRTPDEHPLLESDLQLFSAQFEQVKATYYHLASLLALPLRPGRWFDATLSTLDRVDEVLMRTPARKWAWQVVLELSGPKRAAVAAR